MRDRISFDVTFKINIISSSEIIWIQRFSETKRNSGLVCKKGTCFAESNYFCLATHRGLLFPKCLLNFAWLLPRPAHGMSDICHRPLWPGCTPGGWWPRPDTPFSENILDINTFCQEISCPRFWGQDTAGMQWTALHESIKNLLWGDTAGILTNNQE